MLPTPAKAARILKYLVKSPTSRYLTQKPWLWVIVFFYVCLFGFIIAVTPARIAQVMYDIAQNLRDFQYGYVLLIAAMIITSFPPFIGHGPLLYLFGFTYSARGLIPAAVGTLVSSVVVFVTLRMTFGKRLRLRTSSNEKWRALEAVIRSRGMPLIILIRISSLVPWAWSNSFFASVGSVSLLQFFVATLFVLPRVWVNVVVGSRVAKLSDFKQRSRMIMRVKILNGFLIIGGILSSIIASSLIYYFIRKEIKRLRESSERGETEEEEPLSYSAI
ncbi:Golgi apparatus membrane protein TVP38 [Suillus cothurnatus]|nr:Golgi apparatus membrane protein TVP38 [Suillus cothurnatus]